VSAREDRDRRPPRGERVRDLEGGLSAAPRPPADPAGGRRYRLRSSIDPVVGRDGALYLVRAGDDDLVIRDPEPADRALLGLLAGGEHTLSELARRLERSEAAVAAKLASLSSSGAVVAAPPSAPLDRDDAQRYSRQLPYLADLGDARRLQRRLAAALVVVIGCGGLGTWVLAGLAAAGVRRLRVVDDDRVELSNLNRQILYTPADVGEPKARATAAWLRAFDRRVEVEPLELRVDGPETAARLAAGADALVLAADTPPYVLARWINAACVEHGVPFITGGQLPPLLRIGPLYVPGRTACFACHETTLRRTSADYDGYVRHLRSTRPRGATLGPASGIVGSMMAMEVVHALVDTTPATAGAALLLDLRTGRSRREVIARDSACPACQHLA
jgi:bacteriocin biosynthesis cyclodehydratase domain-containing protein